MIYTGAEQLPEVIEPSLTAMILHRIASTPDAEAFRYPDADEQWQSLSWAQAGDQASTWAAGLIALGVKSEDRVGIASETNIEWTIAALAIALAGAAFTTVYSPDRCRRRPVRTG